MNKADNAVKISNRKSNREFCYIDADGTLTDIMLHEEILGGISEEDQRILQEEAVKRAVADGIPEEIARELYLSD